VVRRHEAFFKDNQLNPAFSPHNHNRHCSFESPESGSIHESNNTSSWVLEARKKSVVQVKIDQNLPSIRVLTPKDKEDEKLLVEDAERMASMEKTGLGLAKTTTFRMGRKSTRFTTQRGGAFAQAIFSMGIGKGEGSGTGRNPTSFRTLLGKKQGSTGSVKPNEAGSINASLRSGNR